MTAGETALGCEHFLRYTSWSPDRDLNPKYIGTPDVDPIGAIIRHPGLRGEECEGSILFASEVARKVFKEKYNFWTVVSFQPLTLQPSIQCPVCSDHGFITNGMWVPAS